jgi:hypothetical protein
MLEMLENSCIVRTRGQGVVTKESLSPAQSPRDQGILRTLSLDGVSPRRTPVAMRGRRPPLLLPGAPGIAADDALAGSMALRRDSQTPTLADIPETLPKGSSRSPEAAGDDGWEGNAAEVAARVERGMEMRIAGVLPGSSGDAACRISSNCGECLDSPARFGGRYSPRDGFRTQVASEAGSLMHARHALCF